MYYTEQEFVNLIAQLGGAKIIYSKDGIYLIKVDDFYTCHKLFYKQTIHWCIAREQYHWDEYVKIPGNRQYFIVDFNHVEDAEQTTEGDRAFIGFTYDKNNKLYAAHSRSDRNLNNHHYYDDDYELDFNIILKKKHLYNFIVKRGMTAPQATYDSEASMIPVYVLIITILLAMCTLLKW